MNLGLHSSPQTVNRNKQKTNKCKSEYTYKYDTFKEMMQMSENIYKCPPKN